MGGKNHQPCRRFLLNSTLLSRAMSKSFAHLEMANVALEDIIIAELNDGVGDVTLLHANLKDSIMSLDEMRVHLTSLRTQMQDENFVDLPSLRHMNLQQLGQQMKVAGTHNDPAQWGIAQSVMRVQGFFGMVDLFGRHINELETLTTELIGGVERCQKEIVYGTLHAVLEENKALNFKREFARVYTAWSNFQQLFLASSLISTEAWYRFNSLGSLLGSDEATANAA